MTLEKFNEIAAQVPVLPNPFIRPSKMYSSPNVNPFTGRLIDPVAEAKRVFAKHGSAK